MGRGSSDSNSGLTPVKPVVHSQMATLTSGSLDSIGSGLGISIGNRAGLHTNGHEERAEGLPGALVSPAKAHDSGEGYLVLVEVCLYIADDAGPGVSDAMVIDRAELVKEQLCI